jgi:chromosome segregation ATPase
MTAPDADYQTVLRELDAICKSFTMLVASIDLAKINDQISNVTKQSKDQMEMLEKIKVKILRTSMETSSMDQWNTTLSRRQSDTIGDLELENSNLKSENFGLNQELLKLTVELEDVASSNDEVKNLKDQNTVLRTSVVSLQQEVKSEKAVIESMKTTIDAGGCNSEAWMEEVLRLNLEFHREKQLHEACQQALVEARTEKEALERCLEDATKSLNMASEANAEL